MASDIIPCIIKNIYSANKRWREEALWILSDLLACGEEIIQETLMLPKVLDRIFEIIRGDTIEVIILYLKSSKIKSFEYS